VVLRAGANDYLDAAPSPAVAAAVNGHLLAAVQTLAGAGLRRFLVPSELPWGHSPIELPGVVEADRSAFNGLIADQNAKLQVALTALASQRELELVQPDFHRLFLAVRANPAAYGFDQIDRPVLQLESLIGSADGGGSGSSNLTGTGSSTGAELGVASDRETPEANGFLWWDSWAHLTTAFHRLLAQEASAALAGQLGSQVIG
jgi:phospholipase/lecithinase/hemolysin